jgi:predicted ATPase/class 3 adenylate cyclase
VANAAHPPGGIVTFVFTDIEGSTRLLRRLGDQYAELSERHMAVMHTAWDTHGGYEIGSAGDSVFVAFDDAAAAVRACADAQQLLAREPWRDGENLRVRMGVHSGLAVPRAGNYTALAANQTARVMSAAHGGQVLVSDATVDLLPDGDRGVTSLGHYRVRDFDGPVELFTLPATAATFPAVRAVPADGHNLVRPPTPLLGRTQELAELSEQLHPGGLVSLIGPGGVGKTRLANEIGRAIAPSWPDGVWMVDLAPLHDASLIATAVAAAVGASAGTEDPWRAVLDHLRDRSALIVFDNCEHLHAACAAAADELVTECPACAVLATSREPLGIARETVHRVPPLAPDAAEQLFRERAQAVGHHVEDDAAAEEICRRLDGVPLAIELAAARLGALRPADVLAGLTDRFRLLRSRDATVPERQRTMEALLDWSERLLTDAERACLHRLSVFGASFTVPAAAAAAGFDGVDHDDVPELVWSLVDKSLVVADLTANETRYRLLESIRDFAAQRLDDAPRAEASVRLADWYLTRIGPEHRYERGWASDVSVDVDNLRALVPPLASAAPEQAQRIAYVIVRHLERRQTYRAAIEELTRLLDQLPARTPTRISLWTTLGDLNLRLGQVDAAQRALTEAEALRAAIGPPPEWDDVTIERTRGEIACRSGDNEGAIAAAQRALAGPLTLLGRARMSNQLGIAALELGDVDVAWDAFAQERDAYQQLGEPLLQASATGNMAEAALQGGDQPGAARHQRACLTLALELGAPVLAAFSMIVAARMAALRDEWTTATTLHGHADLILENTGMVLYDADRRLSDDMLKAAREALGDVDFVAALTAGRALDLPTVAGRADAVLAAIAAEE